MRILNISFKNINSLEGEGRVYFDQGPIADSGVFAITGPNGSGKSSILDVITLGLYGETFRFNKPAAHVMTKQTTECFAQVEFALGGSKFRSNWAVKSNDFASDASMALPKMTLTRIDGEEELLAETPNQVRNQIAEMTGMDFNRFTKSIVLPQSNFAAFLNALDSERMDILEKISGNDLYDDYRRQAEQQFAQTQTRLSQLQQDIAGIPLLDDNALEAASLDLQDFMDQAEELKQRQQQFQQQQTALQNIATHERQQQQLQRKRQDLLVKIAHYQQDLDNIANGEAALPFRADLALLDDKQTKADQQQATLDSYRKELAMLQRQLGDEAVTPPLPDQSFAEQKQIVDTLKLTLSELKLELPRQRELAQSIQQQLGQNQAALSELDEWLAAHQSDASLIDDFPDIVRLRNLRNELIELGGSRKSHAGWIKNTEAALKKAKSTLESTQADLADLKAQIETDSNTLQDISQGKTFEELKELQQEQQARVSDLQEMYSLADATEKLTHKGWLVRLGLKKPVDLPPNVADLQTQLDELNQEMSREQNITKVLEQALRNEALIKKMGPDRNKLVDGQPCYLCGSTTHPYVLKPPVFTDAKKALVDQRGKTQELRSRIEHVSSQLKVAQKYDTQMTARHQRLQQMHSQWTVLANRLNIVRGHLNIGDLSRQKQILVEETNELTKINDLVKRHAQLQRGIARMKGEIETKQASLEKLTRTEAELTARWNNRPPEFDEAEKLFAERSTEEKNLVEKLNQQLSLLGEKLPARGKENPLFDRLNSRRQDYQVYQLRQQGIQKEMAALNDKLEACKNKIDTYQQKINSDLEALSQQELVSLHLAIIEKQKLIIDQEQQLRVTQIEHKTILQALTDKITGTPFETIEALRALLQLLDQEGSIRQRLSDDRAELEKTDRQQQELQAQLEAEIASAGDLVADDIQQMLSDISKKIDIAEQEIRTLENKLTKQRQFRERFQTLQTQIAEQQQQLAAADAQIKLINEDPAGFRRQIQEILVDKLLSKANQSLEKLSGRYYVRKGASELGLALEIEDTRQKNVHRAPQSLSGGESFVVSLALALALTEIANNGHAIDSLFLDEGFGSLDAESLYLAMSTLENLKAHGKTVGIISHVEGVKTRIKTQIELVKKPNGLSELRMVA